MRPIAQRWALLIAAAVGCGSGEPAGATDLFAAFEAARSGEPITASTRLGAAVATVKLSPGKPRLGDVLYLELTVEAPAGTDVVMPAFGEALGRFSIDDFDRRPGSQLYQLQAQMSGRMRIPSLRVEVDGEELLTDELAVEIAPITDAPNDLVAGPGRIDVPAPPLVTRWWIWALAAVALAAAVALVLFWARRRGEVARASAYDRAIEELEQLEAAGLPDGDEPTEIDAWYVHLSSIVRQYLEERFAIRAPELTTEEFLREARASLSAGHQKLLGEFLAGCDRVKFAQHTPTAEEMRGALGTALAFVRETKPAEVSPGGAASRVRDRSTKGQAA